MSDLTAAELQLLSQINENLGLLRESMGHLNRRMEVQEKVSQKTLAALAKLEERSSNFGRLEERIDSVDETLTHRLNAHSDRLTSLETSRTQIETVGKTAGRVAGWADKLWPIVISVFGTVLTWLGLNHS